MFTPLLYTKGYKEYKGEYYGVHSRLTVGAAFLLHISTTLPA
jgi:hypothetical protein